MNLIHVTHPERLKWRQEQAPFDTSMSVARRRRYIGSHRYYRGRLESNKEVVLHPKVY